MNKMVNVSTLGLKCDILDKARLDLDADICGILRNYDKINRCI